MSDQAIVSTQRAQALTASSKVLRNTYALLALTLLFSALTAALSMAVNAPYFGLLSLLPYFGLLYATEKSKNSGWGLVWVFALTGWLGFTLGPILNHYVGLRGYEPVLLALGGTAAIFLSLSAYVLVTRKELSFMTGFLAMGMLVAFIAAIANAFLQIQALTLAVSCMFLLLSSALIMWQTSAIIHGGETNYISATVGLYVAIYNLFTLLLGFLGQDD
ncbi:MAG: Bax inhibitor-1/YccA family protein [Pseudomonadales bacterium]|jgi:modulator of FtsH protease|nr:Bax inhibitor-1/YccA family protein [Pseudomonadales bacterium]MCC6530901.1 Bax inhibitor-1/YccA family protein [Pseudomonadales bacterium]HMU90220.1 Bax inhibitor-1/YccA family protein [Pseudomonadales bacterium]HMW15347.1 Bax inhibitor-1/YccA family protein [Pseudomonadales bacterium]HMW82264.1 Bax inhibitor-1/YccA family protein [Pseudomonadales bacterium]